MKNLVYAECSVSFQMLEDKMVVLISDNAVFMVTTVENSKMYNEEFYPVNVEGIDGYTIMFKDGRLVSESNHSFGF